ncbi:MAG: type I asparaginase [Pseudomonadota bacterium]
MSRRKHVLMIYVGGTLGMVASDHGYVPATNLAKLLTQRIPELGDPAMPTFELYEYSSPKDSSNAEPRHWYVLAETILSRAEEFDGFVVIHGTDTLAYMASALSFLLRGLSAPVVLTGSQIPLSELRNDAQNNLVNALQVIALDQCREVTVCFGRGLFRGNRVRKVKARELDAFNSPNFPPLAEIGTEIRFRDHLALTSGQETVQHNAPSYRSFSVAVLPVYPGFRSAWLEAAIETGVQGLVLECYGVGNAPDQDDDFLDALRKSHARGVVVVAVSQCLTGSVSLGLYAAGFQLAESGVISGFDMTPEAALTKLHYLFTQGHGPEVVRDLMQQDLCGELTVDSGTHR